MDSTKEKSVAEGPGGSQLSGDSIPDPRFGLSDCKVLREIFLALCYFASYLVLAQIISAIFQPGRLVSALAQFVPYFFLMMVVAYRGRQLARRDKQTLLIAACLGSVFVVLALDVTKNLSWLNGVPILGRDSHVRNDLSSMAIVVALIAFPAASYFMIQDILSAKRQLDEKVQQLQDALSHVRSLQGLLPICMHCKKIRTDEESWQKIENYITEHSDATFTHALCPECARKHYPDLNLGAADDRPQTATEKGI